MKDIELKVKGKRAIPILWKAIISGNNVVRDNLYIVNHIGGTTYIAFWHLTYHEIRGLTHLARNSR